MAKNKTAGDNQRKGAARARSQIKNPITGTWMTKRDGVKSDSVPFKGVRKVSGKELSESANRFSKAMKRLAKR